MSLWLTKKQILGTISKYAIEAAPLTLPWDLKETLQDIDVDITIDWIKYFNKSWDWYEFADPLEFRAVLIATLYNVERFNNWSLSLLEMENDVKWNDAKRSEYKYNAAHQKELYFIDLDVLITKIWDALKGMSITDRDTNVRLNGNARLTTDYEFYYLDRNLEDAINKIITQRSVDSNKISDGYHTFSELYDHRIALWMTLCKLVATSPAFAPNTRVWKTRIHSDGSSFIGWFVLGMKEEFGEQITYHLPEKCWESCWFAEQIDKAPEFDGHTAADVIERINVFI